MLMTLEFFLPNGFHSSLLPVSIGYCGGSDALPDIFGLSVFLRVSPAPQGNARLREELVCDRLLRDAVAHIPSGR